MFVLFGVFEFLGFVVVFVAIVLPALFLFLDGRVGGNE